MTDKEKQKAIDALKISAPIKALTPEEFKDYIQTLNKVMDWIEQEPKIVPIAEIKFDEDKLKELVNKAVLTVTQQEPCEDAISRKSIKQKLQKHHDIFVNAYGGFSNLPQNDKSRVDEITNCIAMVVNEPPVTPQEPFKLMVEIDQNSVIKQHIIDTYKAESEVDNGKTIDEHKVQLKKLKPFHNGSYGASINFALDIMSKYQKIEQIANDKNTNGDLLRMSEIRRVLEDGND